MKTLKILQLDWNIRGILNFEFVWSILILDGRAEEDYMFFSLLSVNRLRANNFDWGSLLQILMQLYLYCLKSFLESQTL